MGAGGADVAAVGDVAPDTSPGEPPAPLLDFHRLATTPPCRCVQHTVTTLCARGTCTRTAWRKRVKSNTRAVSQISCCEHKLSQSSGALHTSTGGASVVYLLKIAEDSILLDGMPSVSEFTGVSPYNSRYYSICMGIVL